MQYSTSLIPEEEIPTAAVPLLQHAIETYASETNKVYAVWMLFSPEEMSYRAHRKSGTVGEIMKHQLLSERRFFAEFLGLPEPPADRILPAENIPAAFARRLAELARPRLLYLAARDQEWWLVRRPFFDVTRERIWIYWRRILHTAHHRTQLAVCLRLLDKVVPSTYGPTADVTWSGASPTLTVEAAAAKPTVPGSDVKSID